MKTIRFLLFIVILTSKFTILNAEVKPTFVQSFAVTDITGDNIGGPADVTLSPDGTKIHFTNFTNEAGFAFLRQFTLTTPFDISTIDTSSEVRLNLDGGSDDVGTFVQGHAFNNDGTKVFVIQQSGKLNIHTLTTPYDISETSQEADDGVNYRTAFSAGDGDVRSRDIEFNNDGTKMYLVDGGDGTAGDGGVVEYDLSTPFVPSTATFVNELVVTDKLSRYEQDLEFDDDGTRLFVIDANTTPSALAKIAVYKLSTPFHTSTATFVGSIQNFFDASDGTGAPLGLGFSSDGMKLYQTTYTISGSGDHDKVYEYDLSCPYGIVICETETASVVGAQVDFAKKVIHKNTSTVFKRFEWLRRNKEKDNLNSHNINLNFNDPILASLSNKLVASLSTNKSTKTKSRKWSHWSHVDIAFGRAGETKIHKPKDVRTAGLLFGADRKIGDDKFIGAAIRASTEDVDIISSGGTKLGMESLTLNLYGTSGKRFNGLIGFSLLKVNQMLETTTTGKRYGKQAFTSMNFKTQNSYGKLNIKPSAKIDFGVTQLFEYTDYGTTQSNNVETYENFRFKSGGAAAGFIFDSLIVFDDNIVKPNGSFEYIADFSPNGTYKYKNHIDNVVLQKDAKKYSLHNLKGNIGFETIYDNGSTFSINYERFQSLTESSHYDNLYFKLGYISEEDSEFALSLNPTQNYQTDISYKKNVGVYDFNFRSNYSLMSQIPDYGAQIEVISKF